MLFISFLFFFFFNFHFKDNLKRKDTKKVQKYENQEKKRWLTNYNHGLGSHFCYVSSSQLFSTYTQTFNHRKQTMFLFFDLTSKTKITVVKMELILNIKNSKPGTQWQFARYIQRFFLCTFRHYYQFIVNRTACSHRSTVDIDITQPSSFFSDTSMANTILLQPQNRHKKSLIEIVLTWIGDLWLNASKQKKVIKKNQR